jgi:nicotinamide-nucleotide amidase
MDRVALDPLRTAEVVAVGSELLGTTRLDTNSLYLAGRLASLGIDLRAKAVVGDDRATLAQVFAQALARADLVVLTGGLGPTDDDVTREAVAGVLGLALREDAAIVAAIERRFARRGLGMPENNRRQAQVPEGAVVLGNPHGTAPGLFIAHGRQVVVLLPGPPREMKPMIDALCDGLLGARAGVERSYVTSFFVTGRTESHVEEAIQPIYSKWTGEDPPIQTTILAGPGQIEVHLTLRAADAAAARARLDAARDALVAQLGDRVFSADGRHLEEIVGEGLKARGWTIACAESCTGGLLLSRLTDVAGSSAYVRGGVVAYSNDLKTSFVDVPAEVIAGHGAVSEPVAAAMAAGARARANAAIGVGITGIAGPDGGTPQKPVGTVAIAVSGPGDASQARTFLFPGGRAQVKFQATQAALDMVRREVVAGVSGNW